MYGEWKKGLMKECKREKSDCVDMWLKLWVDDRWQKKIMTLLSKEPFHFEQSLFTEQWSEWHRIFKQRREHILSIESTFVENSTLQCNKFGRGYTNFGKRIFCEFLLSPATFFSTAPAFMKLANRCHEIFIFSYHRPGKVGKQMRWRYHDVFAVMLVGTSC